MEITCITESVYSHAITLGYKYTVLEIDEAKRQVKIKGNNKRVYWFPVSCFDLRGKEALMIKNISIQDELAFPLTSAIEVDIELSDGQKRWCFFVTPELLSEVGDYLAGTNIRIHYGVSHMIVVSEITESIIEKALMEIARQGMLIDCTRSIVE